MGLLASFIKKLAQRKGAKIAKPLMVFVDSFLCELCLFALIVVLIDKHWLLMYQLAGTRSLCTRLV
jgi:hypothetical protein